MEHSHPSEYPAALKFCPKSWCFFFNGNTHKTFHRSWFGQWTNTNKHRKNCECCPVQLLLSGQCSVVKCLTVIAGHWVQARDMCGKKVFLAKFNYQGLLERRLIASRISCWEAVSMWASLNLVVPSQGGWRLSFTSTSRAERSQNISHWGSRSVHSRCRPAGSVSPHLPTHFRTFEIQAVLSSHY